MVRPKAFDVDAALDAAIGVFWDKGYDGTSLDDLVAAMGIGRQSLYDTFGDKQTLYRRAIDAYREHGRAFADGHLHSAVDPIAGIRSLLEAVANRDDSTCQRGCLLLNAASEAGRDSDIARQIRLNREALYSGFTAAIRRAQATGAIPADRDLETCAHALMVTFFGLVTAARAGLDRVGRQHAVEVAVRGLTH